MDGPSANRALTKVIQGIPGAAVLDFSLFEGAVPCLGLPFNVSKFALKTLHLVWDNLPKLSKQEHEKPVLAEGLMFLGVVPVNYADAPEAALLDDLVALFRAPRLRASVGSDQLGLGFGSVSTGLIEVEFRKRKALVSGLSALWVLEGDALPHAKERTMSILKLLSTTLAETAMSYSQVKVAIRRKILDGMDLSVEGVSSLLHSNPFCPLAFPEGVVSEARTAAANRQVRLSSAWAKPPRRGRSAPRNRSANRGRSDSRSTSYQSPVVPRFEQPPLQFERNQAQKRPFQPSSNSGPQQQPRQQQQQPTGSQKNSRRNRRTRSGRNASSQ